MIEILEKRSGNMVGFAVPGKLHDDDYKTFVPQMEDAIALRLLARFHDFHGWDQHAAWDDMAFGVKHYSDVEKIALVGDCKWEEWMARLCKPFTGAVDPFIEKTGELNGLVIEAPKFPGWQNLAGMLEHLKFVRNHHQRIRRVALETDSRLGDVAERIAFHFRGGSAFPGRRFRPCRAVGSVRRLVSIPAFRLLCFQTLEA